MPGENKRELLQLDPVVDLALGGLGFFILTLLGNQLILLIHRFLPGVQTWLLTAVIAIAVLIGMIGRKMRRGQHDLPRLVRVAEVLIVAGLAVVCHLGNSLLTMVVAVVPVLIVYEMAYELAHLSEELLFDFAGFAARSNWQQRWETEGYRQYDRHIVGFRHLQNLLLAVDGFLVLAWLIAGRIGFWELLGSGFVLLFQLIFVGVAFYQKKRIFWAIHGYEVDSRVVQRLLGLVVALAVAVTTLAVALPVNYNPIPWKTMGDWINSLLNGKEYKTILPSTVVTNEPAKTEDEIKQQPIMEMKDSWHVWVFFALVAVIALFFLAIVVGYLLSYLSEERYRLQGLPALLVRLYRYFLGMIKGWLRGLRQGFAEVKTNLEYRRERRLQAKLQKRLEEASNGEALNWQPQDEREKIVYHFLRVMKMFRERGCTRADSQTLTEYLTAATQQFPRVREEIGAIRKLVEEAVYSLHQPNAARLQVMVDAVQRVEHSLQEDTTRIR